MFRHNRQASCPCLRLENKRWAGDRSRRWPLAASRSKPTESGSGRSFPGTRVPVPETAVIAPRGCIRSSLTTLIRRVAARLSPHLGIQNREIETSEVLKSADGLWTGSCQSYAIDVTLHRGQVFLVHAHQGLSLGRELLDLFDRLNFKLDHDLVGDKHAAGIKCDVPCQSVVFAADRRRR
jgi:hypothetical protein